MRHLDGGNQGSYLIFLVDTDYHCNLLSWQSKRLKRIPRSSLAAETVAALDGTDAAIYIREIFYELTDHQMLVTLFTDNKSLYDTIKSSKYVQNKRLGIDVAAVKESISRNEIENVEWINTKQQLPYPLTKSGAKRKSLLNTIITGSILVSDP